MANTRKSVKPENWNYRKEEIMKNYESYKKQVAGADAEQLTRIVQKKCDYCTQRKGHCNYGCDESIRGFMNQETMLPCRIVKWSDGEINDILSMLYWARNGRLDLSDYWNVGDEREVKFNSSTTAKLVLMNRRGMKLYNEEECEFIVGFKDCIGIARMNQEFTNKGGYEASRMKKIVDGIFKDLPSFYHQLFEKTADGFFLSLPSEMNVFGECIYSDDHRDLQFEYYKEEKNRIKQFEGIDTWWWLRSPYSGNSLYFCAVISDGSAISNYANGNIGIAPFGCI